MTEALLMMLAALTAASIILGLSYSINSDKLLVQERLQIYTREAQKESLPPELQLSLKDRIIKPAGKKMSRLLGRIMSGDTKQAYEKRLQAAGNPYGLNAESFLALKYTVFIASLILGVLLRNGLVLFVLLVLQGKQS